ncbi:type IX secretion system anionic LPS delivery protein PorZ [Polaribacter sp.]|uniref:type IX secretion system anionic LPS delivery protein PorZ n=1 Tax=Polaribacter sp. TaxID=1920175 RepID=UPI003F6AB1EE
MKKVIFLFLFCVNSILFSQVDYSDSWQDFYSYNNVKDFVKVGDIIYALVDNAVFTFDENTSEIQKFSSIQGLSGETTSAMYYSVDFDRLVIGYENGLIEVIDENGAITISSDVVNFNQSGNKRINHIAGFGNTLYLSTPFAIVEYDIEKLEFGDTFFIGNGSTSLIINKTLIANNTIYAVTEDGIFTANVTSNLLIDFNNWQQTFSARNFTNIVQFNNQIYISEGRNLFELNAGTLSLVNNFSENIINVNASSSHLSITLQKSSIVLDAALNEVTTLESTTDFDYTLSNSLVLDNTFYLATKEFGILTSNINQFNSYTEIHPEGPLSNGVFSIDVLNNNLWVVYGGYSPTYAPNFNKQGFSQFNGVNWINTQYNPDIPVTDLSDISIDPNDENRVFLGSFGTTNQFESFATGGLAVVENNEITAFYNQQNSPLDDIDTRPSFISIRVPSTVFDNQGNLWVTNVGVQEELKKLSPSNQWTSYDLSSIKANDVIGLTEIIVDKLGNKWIGTRRNGVYAFNENGNRKRALSTLPNVGNLPNLNVLTLAADNSNRIWIGTRTGMVVFRNASNIFDAQVLNAEPVIIEENGVGERLLGDQTINTIVVDGADNKWFGTDSGGVLYTNPSGQTTLAKFSTENSPLPSNKILKIRVDDINGKVYFATDKGIVVYNSNVAPFGEVLGDVYAYPNPALKNHATITIDGRNGTHLPQGTNVKILDVAGNLVYETNVIEGQELQGGKVVWNKKNLAGNKVASGVYIVLMTNEDASETATVKIAIVN